MAFHRSAIAVLLFAVAVSGKNNRFLAGVHG
jgi:hypothetical protein